MLDARNVIAERLRGSARVRPEALFDEAARRVARLRLPPGEGNPFRAELPDGSARQFGRGAPAFTIVARDDAGTAALASFDDLAFAEAYLHGHLDVDGDLYEMLVYRPMLSDRRPLHYLWETYLQPLLYGQVAADKKTIPAHYDLPSDFFTLWLDRAVRGYSHAFFERDDEPLEEAMVRKFEFALRATGLKAGDRLLDIGGGWGSLVQFAGERGIHVTSVTISKESARFMRDLVRRRSLPGEIVEEHFLEFRSARRFDAIINLGVTEHLPDYRRTLAQYDRLLHANRRVYLDAYTGPRYSMSSFVTKWVYEGNTSPLCLGRYFSELERTDFVVKLLDDDTKSYQLTCRKWAERLEAAREEIVRRWGELLYRRFRLYLWGCARCFADGQLGAAHLVLERRPGLHARAVPVLTAARDATPGPPDRWFFEHRFLPFWAPLGWYHRYRLVGAEHLPAEGPAIVLTTHSAATYELFLFIAAAYRATGRIVRPLGDRLWFATPGLREACLKLGGVEATPEASRALLDRGDPILLSPGGVWESVRPSTQKHKLRWGRRRGFARLALEARCPVLLLACPAADDLYTVYESRVTDWAYRRWKFPLPLVRGLGPTWLPRPVALTGYLSPAVALPPPHDPIGDDDVEAARAHLERAMLDHLARVARGR